MHNIHQLCLKTNVFKDKCLSMLVYQLAVWLSGTVLASINVVPLHQTRLVPNMGDHLWAGKTSQYVTSQLGRLSLLPSAGQYNEYQLSD